jgi:hypothetical protein
LTELITFLKHTDNSSQTTAARVEQFLERYQPMTNALADFLGHLVGSP